MKASITITNDDGLCPHTVRLDDVVCTFENEIRDTTFDNLPDGQMPEWKTSELTGISTVTLKGRLFKP